MSRPARRCPVCGKAAVLTRQGTIGWHLDTRDIPGKHPVCAGYHQPPTGTDMTTHYPPGMDGPTVMRNTAAALQTTLNQLLMADCTATALDEDMLELRISGMHARVLLRTLADHGVITYPRINAAAQAER